MTPIQQFCTEVHIRGIPARRRNKSSEKREEEKNLVIVVVRLIHSKTRRRRRKKKLPWKLSNKQSPRVFDDADAQETKVYGLLSKQGRKKPAQEEMKIRGENAALTKKTRRE